MKFFKILALSALAVMIAQCLVYVAAEHILHRPLDTSLEVLRIQLPLMLFTVMLCVYFVPESYWLSHDKVKEQSFKKAAAST